MKPKTGWLSPDAELIECGYREHLSMADELVRRLGLPERWLNDDVLMEAGWIKISRTETPPRQFKLYFPIDKHKLVEYCSPAQRKYCRSIFLDGFDEIDRENATDFREAGIIDEEEYLEWQR